MTCEQKDFVSNFTDDPPKIYKLLRTPAHLDEIDWEKLDNTAICRKNGLIIWIGRPAIRDCFTSTIPFTVHVGEIQRDGAIFNIQYKEDHDGIIETAALLASRKRGEGRNVRIEIDVSTLDRDTLPEVLKPNQIACLLDACPTRKFELLDGFWYPEQSVVLATRPYPIDLILGEEESGDGCFQFQDEGAAFVDALVQREASFGSLSLRFDEHWVAIGYRSLRRLFGSETHFEKLELCKLDDLSVLFPFEANTEVLEYDFYVDPVDPDVFNYLDIFAKDLRIKMLIGFEASDRFFEAVVDPFWARLAELGHFERLSFTIVPGDYFHGFDFAPSITDTMISVIKYNPNLKYLTLGDSFWCPDDEDEESCYEDSSSQMRKVSEAIEEHPALLELTVEHYSWSDPDFTWLKRLLSRNRRITVRDSQGRRCSNGTSIDRLYSLNRFYCFSPDLVNESDSLRTSLVGTALVGSAAGMYESTALLLSNHTDVLCELIHGLNLEDLFVSVDYSLQQAALMLISDERLTPKQRHFFIETRRPIYRLLRKSISLDEFEWEHFRDIAVWFENDTVILLSKRDFYGPLVPFTVHAGKYELTGSIYSVTDDVYDILETAAYLCALNRPGEGNARVEVYVSGFSWGLIGDTFEPHQIAGFLDQCDTRRFEFADGYWGAGLSYAFASRPYPLDLTFTETSEGYTFFKFEDDGTAFLDALEKRQSSFGSLCLEYSENPTPFSPSNLERLFRLNTHFEKLELSGLVDECVLLPFGAKTNTLEYEFYAETMEPASFDSLDIVTKDLRVKMFLGHDDLSINEDHDGLVISFLNRLAELGHFERLDFSIDAGKCFDEFENESAVIAALIHALKANKKLVCSNLSSWCLDVSELENLFQAIEDHQELRELYVRRYPSSDPDFLLLKRLLTRNRNITVYHRSFYRCTDGSTIDDLYLLNRMHKALPDLRNESPSQRSLLANTALAQRAFGKFPHTALLLSNHTDVLD